MSHLSKMGFLGVQKYLIEHIKNFSQNYDIPPTAHFYEDISVKRHFVNKYHFRIRFEGKAEIKKTKFFIYDTFLCVPRLLKIDNRCKTNLLQNGLMLLMNNTVNTFKLCKTKSVLISNTSWAKFLKIICPNHIFFALSYRF